MKPKVGRIVEAVAWRLHRLLGDRIVYGGLLKATTVWRRVLKKTVFIGIVGSAGKTTAKELFTGMLANHGKAVGNRASFNNIEEIAKTMLRARPNHRAFVSELSEDRPGVVRQQTALLRPSVGIVTVVKDDHLAAFESREAIAVEMQSLIASLPTSGTAVLNADDPLVLAMAAQCRAKVLTYGLSSKAELRAEDVSSAWPDRLQMTLVRGTQRVKLVTQLCGTHWIPSVLGAIGGGLATGLTLQECAQGLASVPPFEGRMQPVTTPEGVTFIRDDFKAPLWTLDACFEFMWEANAKRKIIVIGDISDTGSTKSLKFARVAVAAQAVAEITVFVGPWATSVLKAQIGEDGRVLRVFSNVRDAANYIQSVAHSGDVVLLKGTNRQNHLQRIILTRDDAVACWRDDCARQIFCSACPDRMKPSGPSSSLPAKLSVLDKPPLATSPLPRVDPAEQIIIGFGNPGAQFANTPHNAGYEMIDGFATGFALEWKLSAGVLTARGTARGHRVCLMKLLCPMNLTGAALMNASQSMGFQPGQCILVYDDLSLPLGKVRQRQSGSAGGHRGVASVLEAFQTDAFRRVKIGIRPNDTALRHLDYVLTAWAAPDQAVLNQAVGAAITLIVGLFPKAFKGDSSRDVLEYSHGPAKKPESTL